MFIKKTFKVAADMKELETVTSCVRKILDEIEAPSRDSMKVEVIVEEIFSNIALYAYKDIKPDVSKSVEDKGGLAGLIDKFKSGPVSPYAKISITVPDDKGSITVEFQDEGTPYNPLEKPDPDITASVEDRPIGGLGIYMSKQMMDDIEYKHDGKHNILKFKKIFRQ